MSKFKSIKKNYFIIPLSVILVAFLGSSFTSAGMAWYDTLFKPELLPPRWVFPVAWNIIFVFCTASALILWNHGQTKRRTFIFSLFCVNGILNVLWCILFFGFHLILFSFYEIFFLELTNVLLILFSWKYSKWGSVLLLPYFLWVLFAAYLTYEILTLNIMRL